MSLKVPGSLVNVDWLSDHIGKEKLIVLDASVPPVVPGFVSINSSENFLAIPGARRFDYDQKICKPDSFLPHMMPSPELFEKEARQLGIDKSSVIVVYDDVGIYASPRAWWMLRAMGHEQVAVLDGGLPAWVEAGLDVEKELASSSVPGNFNASLNEELFCDFELVLKSLDDPGCCIIDARSAGRFDGTVPEPRLGLRSGHMPNAKNLPFPELLNDGKMKTIPELLKLFQNMSSNEQRIITSCGSGITACVLTLAAHLAGYDQLSVYDGSWAEWGAPSHLPVTI